MAKSIVLDIVGLTPRLLAHAPRLRSLGPPAPLTPPLPAVTCTSQATMLTGSPPRDHGIVANGWYERAWNEVLFWRQSNRLVAGRMPWEEAHAKTAVLFWWFNMATSAEVTVTPRPAYFADGRKGPDVYATPPELGRDLQREFGEFPLFRFWGPGAGGDATRWIADAAIATLARHDPDLCLVYLPHLDYDLQRFGPDDPRIPAQVRFVDEQAGRILDAAPARKALVVSEYGITRVDRTALPNRALREAGLLAVQENATGELLDPFRSRAFAVCDHQLAHVYVRDPADLAAARQVLERLDGLDRLLDKRAAGLDHERSGELVALAAPGCWFAYPYWLDDSKAPDFARTVDIHRKPGYDPCELFLDPGASKLSMAWTLARRKLGFRTTFRVVPLDPSIVRGSHGRLPSDPADGPLLLGDGAAPRPMSAVRDAIIRSLA
ncbi:MAG: alkaline phosphatase family protein [Planctomycetaceae bacterium]